MVYSRSLQVTPLPKTIRWVLFFPHLRQFETYIGVCCVRFRNTKSQPICLRNWHCSVTKNETWQFPLSTYWCLVGNGWEWGNGMMIDSNCGSFPHSLLSTSKSNRITKWNMPNKPTSRIRIPCRGVSQPCSPSSVITTSCWRFPCWAKAASRMLRCYRCWSIKEVIVYSFAGFLRAKTSYIKVVEMVFDSNMEVLNMDIAWYIVYIHIWSYVYIYILCIYIYIYCAYIYMYIYIA